MHQKFKIEFEHFKNDPIIKPVMAVKLVVQRAPTMAVQRAPPWLFNKHVLSQWQQVVWAKETYIKLSSWFDITSLAKLSSWFDITNDVSIPWYIK